MNQGKIFLPLIQIVLLFTFVFSAFMKNNYVAQLELVKECPNNNETVNKIRNLKFFSYNRTHKAYNYDITYNRALDEKVGIAIEVERWGDGGWKSIPFMSFQPNCCKYMLKYFRATWFAFYENVGYEHPETCPIPKGNYSVRNYITDLSPFKIPFFSGRFKFTSKYADVDTKQPIFCFEQVINIAEVF